MKELEETIIFLEQQIEKLKEIRNSNEVWMPSDGESYFLIEKDFSVRYDRWSNHDADYELMGIGNLFKTQQEAEKYAEHFKQILKNREL